MSKARDLSNFISDATVDASEIADLAVTHAKLHTDMNLSSKTLTFAANQISGNAIDGGVISNFASTGIDDNSSATAVTILSDGKVGIGTDSPNTSLDIVRNGVQPLRVQSTSGTEVEINMVNTGGNVQLEAHNGNFNINADNVGIGTSSPSDFAIGDLVVGDGSGARGITIYSGNGSGIEGIIRFADGTSGSQQYQGQIKYDHSGDFMRFYTAASERMRIASNGMVLVGGTTNTSGGHQLKVGGSGNDGEITLSSDTTASYIVSYDRTAGAYHPIISAASEYQLNGGNVGIGTASPGNALRVVASSSQATTDGAVVIKNEMNNGFETLKLETNNDRDSVLSFRSVGTNSYWWGMGIDNSDGGKFKMGADNLLGVNNRLVITQAGNVGIGTSSPSYNLHLSSSGGSTLALTAGSTENAQVRFGDSSDDDAGKINYDNSTNHMAFHTNASERMRIDADGYTSTNNPRLTVGSGNYNARTGKTGIRVGRTVYNWFNYGSNGGGTYLHIKTNLANTGSNSQATMSSFHIRGYTYAGDTIDSILGFHNWSGNYHATSYRNNGSRTVVSGSYGPYTSTDNKVVIVLDIGTSYPGISIDYMQNFEYTWRDVEVSAYSKSASGSGVY